MLSSQVPLASFLCDRRRFIGWNCEPGHGAGLRGDRVIELGPRLMWPGRPGPGGCGSWPSARSLLGFDIRCGRALLAGVDRLRVTITLAEGTPSRPRVVSAGRRGAGDLAGRDVGHDKKNRLGITVDARFATSAPTSSRLGLLSPNPHPLYDDRRCG